MKRHGSGVRKSGPTSTLGQAHVAALKDANAVDVGTLFGHVNLSAEIGVIQILLTAVRAPDPSSDECFFMLRSS